MIGKNANVQTFKLLNSLLKPKKRIYFVIYLKGRFLLLVKSWETNALHVKYIHIEWNLEYDWHVAMVIVIFYRKAEW